MKLNNRRTQEGKCRFLQLVTAPVGRKEVAGVLFQW